MVEGGVSQYYLSYDFMYQDNVLPGAVAKTDLTLQTTWGARPGGFFTRGGYKRYYMGNVAYVTGSHNLKAGVQYNQATEYRITTSSWGTSSSSIAPAFRRRCWSTTRQ